MYHSKVSMHMGATICSNDKAISGFTKSPWRLCKPLAKHSHQNKFVEYVVMYSFVVAICMTVALGPSTGACQTFENSDLSFLMVPHWMLSLLFPWLSNCSNNAAAIPIPHLSLNRCGPILGRTWSISIPTICKLFPIVCSLHAVPLTVEAFRYQMHLERLFAWWWLTTILVCLTAWCLFQVSSWSDRSHIEREQVDDHNCAPP